MRVSSIEGDAGHARWREAIESGKRVEVYLDGIEQKYCSIADTELGIVRRCVLDGEGKLQCNPASPDEIWTEDVSGAVTVEFA